ncbi:hypothetical protein P171DRAFT_491822 [Karstenula rhodostoma CBS 690.94]|uniref:Peptidase S9 prolyl oligopeptidase catalytic domain-containing protein n=1 Tax=Karstenula rhodostoma CBS 690.94 TaxID=1392251 RepID=A0A9P4P443_9PLEO|nr:hypothetical protein P171DRAFT_491822 [Karstenula rhodostoma CBS 690.94]
MVDDFVQMVWFCDGIAGKVESTVPLPCITSSPHNMLLEHAEDDEVVPMRQGIRLRDTLEELGANVEWRGYGDGGHWVNEPAGIDAMVKFIELQSDNN